MGLSALGVYYNEWDGYAARWLRNLIDAGHLPHGVVDERSIVDVQPDEIPETGHCRVHSGVHGDS